MAYVSIAWYFALVHNVVIWLINSIGGRASAPRHPPLGSRFAPLVESLRSISDEMYTVLLALPSGNEDFRPNVAEKSVFGVRKTLKS